MSRCVEARRLPSGDQATLHTESQANWITQTPVSASQIRTVSSSDPDARRRLFGDQLRDLTVSLCPSKVTSSLYVRGSHNFIVGSTGEASRRPLEDHATHKGYSPPRVFICLPVVALNMRVLEESHATQWLSGDQLTSIGLGDTAHLTISWPVSLSQIRTDASPAAVANLRPSGDQLTFLTLLLCSF